MAAKRVKHKVKSTSPKLFKSEAFTNSRFSKANLIIFALIFAAFGGYAIYKSFAAGPTASIEPENGTIVAPATVINDTNASGGKAVQFGTVSSGGTLNGWQMNATNTGPTGTLTSKSPSQLPGVTCNGSLCNVSVAGTTISNVDISGDFGITASNVTISNCRIHGEVRVGQSISGGSDTPVTNTHITHCELDGTGNTYEGILVVASTHGLWDFNNIHNYENGITEWTGTGDSIINNYLHDDSNATSGGHIDGLEIYGVSQGMTITGNYVVMAQTSSTTAPLNLTPTGHFDGTVTVNNNLFASKNCAYVILGDDSQGNTPIIASISNNRLIPLNSSCGYYSLRHNQPGSTYTGSGNVDGNTLNPVPNPN
jgi:hypothetical protein